MWHHEVIFIGLVFVKVGVVEELFNIMSCRVYEFAKLLRETETVDIEDRDNEGN